MSDPLKMVLANLDLIPVQLSLHTEDLLPGLIAAHVEDPTGKGIPISLVISDGSISATFGKGVNVDFGGRMNDVKIRQLLRDLLQSPSEEMWSRSKNVLRVDTDRPIRFASTRGLFGRLGKDYRTIRYEPYQDL